MRKKEEALNAIDTARAIVDGQPPLQGLQIRQLRTVLQFARDTVAELEELKRPRKPTKAVRDA